MNYILAHQRVTVYACQSSDSFDIHINGFSVSKSNTSLRVQMPSQALVGAWSCGIRSYKCAVCPGLQTLLRDLKAQSANSTTELSFICRDDLSRMPANAFSNKRRTWALQDYAIGVYSSPLVSSPFPQSNKAV
jgi:hypothetical protein